MPGCGGRLPRVTPEPVGPGCDARRPTRINFGRTVPLSPGARGTLPGRGAWFQVEPRPRVLGAVRTACWCAVSQRGPAQHAGRAGGRRHARRRHDRRDFHECRCASVFSVEWTGRACTRPTLPLRDGAPGVWRRVTRAGVTELGRRGVPRDRIGGRRRTRAVKLKGLPRDSGSDRWRIAYPAGARLRAMTAPPATRMPGRRRPVTVRTSDLLCSSLADKQTAPPERLDRVRRFLVGSGIGLS